jgi:hypothetical protein
MPGCWGAGEQHRHRRTCCLGPECRRRRGTTPLAGTCRGTARRSRRPAWGRCRRTTARPPTPRWRLGHAHTGVQGPADGSGATCDARAPATHPPRPRPTTPTRPTPFPNQSRTLPPCWPPKRHRRLALTAITWAGCQVAGANRHRLRLPTHTHSEHTHRNTHTHTHAHTHAHTRTHTHTHTKRPPHGQRRAK